MACPQKENGHLDIANEIAEALCQINLSPYESRILWVIWRKTYGWNKKSDCISYSQIEKLTRLKHSNIWRTLKKLQKRNLILARRKSQLVEYQFQKNYELWDRVPSKLVVSPEILPKQTLVSGEIMSKPPNQVSPERIDPVSNEIPTITNNTILQLPAEVENNSLDLILTIYEQNVGKVTPLLKDRMEELLEEYPGLWIKDAITDSIRYNKPNLAYVERILQNRKNGFPHSSEGRLKDGWQITTP